MKLKSFRIKNYKSIIDSNECRLSDHDNIAVLAGQNESGKSSILQALRDFEKNRLSADSQRDDDSFPIISCTYSVSDVEWDFEDILSSAECPKSIIPIIETLNEITFVKTFSGSGAPKMTALDTKLISDLTKCLEDENKIIEKRSSLSSSSEDASDEKSKRDDLYIIDETISDLIKELSYYTPSIIFFDDFCDLLPDSITISDLKNNNRKAIGYQAVKNIETILGGDFTKFEGLSDGKKETVQNSFHDVITASFNEKWKQRIAEGDGAKIHIKYYQGGASDASYLNFFIETTKNEFLPPSKRSQGFKWFLSFFLRLKAEDKKINNLVILFDEPGLYLHSKAQSDMIAVFEELAEKSQIIYSTHSPYLIDTTKLHRLRLVLNTKTSGSTIEKITSGKIKNQKEALKPIIDALGLELATPFSVAKKHNVILEGISDFYYMHAMKHLLRKEYDIGLLPSMGAANCHLLMELCIGWGLEWVIIFDDKGAVKDFNKIKREFFNNSEVDANNKIYRMKGCDGIEDVFAPEDLKLVNKHAEFTSVTKNSEMVKNYGGKELYSRLFHEKVVQGEIQLNEINKTTRESFSKIFEFIEEVLGIRSTKVEISIKKEVNNNLSS